MMRAQTPVQMPMVEAMEMNLARGPKRFDFKKRSASVRLKLIAVDHSVFHYIGSVA